MKKFVSLALAAVMLAAPITPYQRVFGATNEKYLNFDGFDGVKMSPFEPVKEHLAYISRGTDPEGVRGDNAKLTARSDTDGPLSNWNDKQNVLGFSIYNTDATRFTVNMKCNNSSGGTGWLSGIFQIDGGKLKYSGTVIADAQANKWYDVRIALDFTAHTSTIYIDGVKMGSKNIDSSFTSVAYSGMNALKTSVSGETYIDDGIAYSTNGAELLASSVNALGEKLSLDLPLSLSAEYIEIDLGGEVARETASEISAVISDGENVIKTRTEFVGKADHLSDYPRTMRIYVEDELLSKTRYTLDVSGVKNLIGKDLSKTFTFETENNDPTIFVSYESTLDYGDEKEIPEGTKVNFTVTNYNLPDGDTIEILQNGEKMGSLSKSDAGFSLKLVGGENKIVLRSIETGAESEAIVMDAVSYSEELMLSKNFDDKNVKDGFAGVNANGGSIEAVEVSGRDGYVMKLQSETGDGPIVFPVFPTMVEGIVSIEYDAMYESFFKMNFVSAIRTETGNLIPITLTETGMLQTEKKENIKQLELNKWYKIKVHFDIQNMTYSLFIDEEAILVNKPFNNTTPGKIDRMNIVVTHGNGTVSTMYIDNFTQYSLGRDYRSEVELYNSDGSKAQSIVTYEGMSAKINFTEPMAEVDLEGKVTITDAAGNTIPYSASYSGKTYTITTGALTPDTNYSLSVSSEIVSLAGGVSLDGEKKITFKTTKSGFHLASYLLAGGNSLEELSGAKADMVVLYENDSQTTQNGTIFAGIYKGNQLYSYDTKSVNAVPGEGSVVLSMDLPAVVANGAYHTEIYLVDSMDRLNVIDSITELGGGVDAEKMTEGTLVIEAEDMNLDSVMTIFDDSSASGGKAIKVTAPSAALNIGNLPQNVSFGVEGLCTEAGSYAVWLRVKTPDSGADSVWYASTSNVYSLLDFTSTSYTGEYYWKNIGYAVLQPGVFSLNFKYRERNFTVDKMIITNKLGFAPTGKDDVPSQDDSGISSLYPLPEITPIAEHPRLYLTEEIIPDLKENMQSPELSKAYEIMSAYADEELDTVLEYDPDGNWDDDLAEKVEARALMYVLGERDANHGRKTIQHAKEFMSTVCYPNTQDITRDIGDAMVMASVVYDWCYDLLTEEDKEFFIAKLKEFASMKEIGYPPTKMSSIGAHSGEHEIMRDMIGAGIAIYDEDTEMYNLSAGRFFAEYVESRKMFNKSGNHPQGSAYGSYRLESELFATAIFERMGYPAVLGEEIYDVSYKWLYERLPMGAWFKDGDDPDFGKGGIGYYSSYNAMETLLSANLSKDPYLRRQYIKMLNINDYDHKLLWLLLFAEPETGMEETNSLPLARKTTYPLSSIVARTSWDEGFEAPTAMVQMKVQEKFIGDHMHLDSGAFQIYYKGSLATTSGLYQGKHGGHSSDHHMNYAKRTIAHNTLTVFDPDEKVYTIGGAGNYSNDGGQTYGGSSVVMTYEDMMAEGDRASVEGSFIGPDENTPKFSYIKGDLTDSYSDKITKYNRSMVFMDLFNEDYPAAFVVFDQVDSSDASFEKAWHMHAVEEPQIDGTTTVIKRTQGNGLWKYNGKLVNETLYPQNPVIEKVNGFIVDGKEYPAEAYNGTTPEEAEWRIDIKPSTETKGDIFLNAMYVQDADRNLPKLEMAKVENFAMTGVSVMDRLVMFSKSGSRIDYGFSVTIPDNGYDVVSCLITDIKAGSWGIEKGDDLVTVIVNEDEGVLYFEAEPGTYDFLPEYGGVPTAFDGEQVEKSRAGDFLVRVWSTMVYQKHPTKEIDGVPYVAVDGNFNNMFMKAMGASATISDDKRSVTVSRGSRTATITADSDSYIYNGNTKSLQHPTKMIDGEMYVVLSDFMELFGLGSHKYDSWGKILEYH